MDYPHPGAAGNSCFMCNKTAHFLNNCPVFLEYIQHGNAAKNPQNMVMLGNQDPIPSDLANHPWATQMDKYYARSPHLLPQETVQANFSANLLEVHGQGTPKEENSSLFAHLESINEEAELGRYIEVLQARKNEMASGKKQVDLPNPVPPKMDQPKGHTRTL